MSFNHSKYSNDAGYNDYFIPVVYIKKRISYLIA